MKRVRGALGLIVVTALVFTADTLGAADPAKAADAERAAESSAQSWLGLVDAGRYGDSWDAAAAAFKAAVSRSQWEAAVEKVRNPLGKVISRKLRGAQYMTELPNAPAGEYVVIQYDTSFEKKPGAIETITPAKQGDGSWRVAGYYIR